MTAWPRVDPADVAAAITAPDVEARDAAVERQKLLTKPAGSLGVLEDLSVWLSGVQGQCPPRPLENVRVVIVAGDHGVARTAGTSAYPPEVTAQMVLNFLSGGAAVNVLARSNDATVRVVDIAVDVPVDFYRDAIGDQADELTRFRIRQSSGSIDREDALTADEALDAFSAGVAIANEEIDAGADLLIVGDMGIGNTTPAAALVALIARVDPSTVVGRGTGIDDATWMRKCTAVREAMHRGRPVMSDLMSLLATVGGADLACVTGILMQAAARRVPVLLDGVITNACALVAHRMAYGAHDWWLASHRSTEPAATTALELMALDPIVSLNLRLGEGTGALTALPLLRAAGDTLREMATFDEAGVSDH